MSIANDLERYMLELINAERAAVGVAPLQLEQHLNESSEDHSQWVLDTDTFSHTGAGGSTSRERMTAAGFDFAGTNSAGENIGLQSIRGAAGYYDDVMDIFGRLMDSSGHRWNILNSGYDYVGIGIEVGEYKGFTVVMITQNFASTQGSVLLDTGVSAGGGGGATAGNDVLVGTAANDLLKALQGHDDLSGLSGADTLLGGNGNDTLSGGGGADSILGGYGDDLLTGNNGKDTLDGGAGADVLEGGKGRDKLIGGAGQDVFVFTDASHNGTSALRDRIMDFDGTEDVIDLSGIDANTGAGGNQAFGFIGTAAFSGTAGELRYRLVNNGANSEVLADTDGDGLADFFLLVKGVSVLEASDFVL